MATSSSGSSRFVLQPEMNERDIEQLLNDHANVLEKLANDALPDEDIDLSDHPEWTEEMFRHAERGTFYRPRAGEAMVPLDADVIAWFRQRYPKYQAALNAALRSFMDAHADDDRADPSPDETIDHRKTA